MIKEIEHITFDAFCPECGKTLRNIWLAKLDSVIGVRYAYICSNCEKLLRLTKEKDKSYNFLSNSQSASGIAD